jgi:hypothetical protein
MPVRDPIPTRLFPPDGTPAESRQGNGPLRLIAGWLLETRRPEAAVVEPPSPQEQLRREHWRRIATIEDLTQRERAIEGQIEELQRDLQDLDSRFPDYARHRGRRVPYAISCLVCILFSFLLDFAVISAAVEAFLAAAGLSFGQSGWVSLARVLAAVTVSAILYSLGTKYAVARQNGEATWLFLALAMAIAIAVGAFTWETARAGELPGVLPKAMGLLGLAGPLFAFVAGAQIPESLDYLGYISQRRRISSAIRRLEQARRRLGPDFMRQFVELRRVQYEYWRRFGEELLPELSPESQRLFNAYARTAPAAGPRVVLQTVEPAEPARPAAPHDGRPDGEPTVLVNPDGPTEPPRDETVAYLQEVLRRQALTDDATLQPVGGST